MAHKLSPKTQWLLQSLSRYWPKNQKAIEALIADIPNFTPQLPPQLIQIQLPDWAKDIGIGGHLFVPAEATTEGTDYKQVNWSLAAFYYLNCTAERAHEQAHGAIHSYSFRLQNFPPEMWQHAWVNRIALFLRRWAAKQAKQTEIKLFGPLPDPEIILTHDVDAVAKTIPIRFKQFVFHNINALRALAKGDLHTCLKRITKGIHFALTPANYWWFEHICNLEEKHGYRSRWHFYGGNHNWDGWLRNPFNILMDPSYNVAAPKLSAQLKALTKRGHIVGLHPKFNTWENAEKFTQEKQHIANSLGKKISVIRQHWLRFSFADTWKSQAEAGLTDDCTLGFNNRPAFRHAAALEVQPWDEKTKKPIDIKTLPLVLMDSHLYDYQTLSPQQRKAEIKKWLDEIKAVHGIATVVWHQRVFSPDYNWGSGYEDLLKMLPKKTKK